MVFSTTVDSNIKTYLIKVIFLTWLIMARQLESAWHPERRATISTPCRPSRAFSGSIFGGSSGGTAPDKLYAAVAAATIWPAEPGNRSCNRRDNRVNAWRTVSLMDLGGGPRLQPEPTGQGWASVLFKRTFRSFHSFPFFIKECSVLFRSL